MTADTKKLRELHSKAPEIQRNGRAAANLFYAATYGAMPALLDLVDCGGKGCGTDESKACLRCCRIMLANYAANHGTRCDAEQERLRGLAEKFENARHKASVALIEVELERDQLREALHAANERLKRAGCLPIEVPGSQRHVCSTCNDTHGMELNGVIVMCTRCPTPCQQCRSGGNGPYCETTPCECDCHKRKDGAP